MQDGASVSLVLCGTIFSCDTLCGAERQEKKSAIKFEVWNNLSTRVCAASFSFQRHADLVHSRRIRSIRDKVGLARRWNGGAIFQERPNIFIVQNDSFSFRENNRAKRHEKDNKKTPKRRLWAVGQKTVFFGLERPTSSFRPPCSRKTVF